MRDTSTSRVSTIPGVTAVVRREDPEEGLSNRSPGIAVRWDSKKLGHYRQRGRGDPLHQRAANHAERQPRGHARA